MKTILNFKCTPHFLERIKIRRIDPFIISLCLAEGKKIKLKKKKVKYVLSAEQIKDAIKQGYINPLDYKALDRLVVIARGKILITAYKKLSDMGICNILTL